MYEYTIFKKFFTIGNLTLSVPKWVRKNIPSSFSAKSRLKSSKPCKRSMNETHMRQIHILILAIHFQLFGQITYSAYVFIHLYLVMPTVSLSSRNGGIKRHQNRMILVWELCRRNRDSNLRVFDENHVLAIRREICFGNHLKFKEADTDCENLCSEKLQNKPIKSTRF